MSAIDQCAKCGNIHEGSCSTNTLYFYWYPSESETPKEIFIVGDWHQWVHYEKMNKVYLDHGKMYFSKLLALSQGNHEYKYIVDGQWRYDKNAPVVYNPFGGYNNVINVLPKKTYLQKIHGQEVKLVSNICLHNLKILGSWDNWKIQRQMKLTYNVLKQAEQNVIYLDLQTDANYQFIFKYKNQYFIDEKYPTNNNVFGTLNNYIIVTQKSLYPDTPLGSKKSNSSSSVSGPKGKNFRWKKVQTAIQLPYDRVEGHAMCLVGQDLYMFGGKSRGQFYNSLIKINSSFEKVVLEEAVPDGRAFHYMKSYGNRILIYGGHNNAMLTDYHSFVVSDHKWVSSLVIPKVKQVRPQKQSCVLIESLLVFFGGCYCDQQGQLSSIGNQLQVLDLQKMQWVESIKIEGDYPKGRLSHTAETIGANMYIFGGYEGKNQCLNDLWRINLQNVNHLKWQELIPAGKPPSSRYGHSMNELNKMLIIFGGISNNQLMNDLYVYIQQKNQWVTPIVQGTIPKARMFHASCNFLNDSIVIYGGRIKDKSKSKTFFILQPGEFGSQFSPTMNEESDD